MKPDTNTRGNTFWFMFKVSNFAIGQEVTFNIYNFSRNVDTFYNDKMNILTKTINRSDEENKCSNQWLSDKCTHIKFDESIVLKPNEDCFYHLKFKYKFEE